MSRRPPVFCLSLYGFAAWHILDAVFSHWVLRIHRICTTADNPMAWDSVPLRTDTAPAKLFEGMERAGARLLWSDAGGGVWVLKRPESIQPAFFYQYGALYVSGVGMATGCIDWFRL